MRKILVVAIIAAAISAPAMAQLRLDIGIDIPKGISSSILPSTIQSSISDFLSKSFIPFPEAELNYQWDLGMFKLGAGVRAYTVILASVVWPNAFAELDIGPLAIEAQMGGGVFGCYAVSSGSIQTGRVFFPDLSAWYAFGAKKVFRLGLGTMGIFLPNQSTDTLPFIFYLGGKAAIPL
jgi:hypothetical protein